MVEFIEGDPPTAQRTVLIWADIVDKLRTEPGRWAIIAADRSSSSAYSAARMLKGRGAEAKVRKTKGEETWTLYARWPGGTWESRP